MPTQPTVTECSVKSSLATIPPLKLTILLSMEATNLLKPIYQSQLEHILLSKILAIDETPVKAGREKKGIGRLYTIEPQIKQQVLQDAGITAYRQKHGKAR